MSELDPHQIQQLRREVAELKQQITIIQQQSLNAMQEAIDAAFRNKVGDNLNTLRQQEQEALGHASEATQPAESKSAQH